ncbi:LOB domain-containing protein 41 [Euphorbia peplus]|nr:LOB domain-containing protein 41 [Euphorbia peplus]
MRMSCNGCRVLRKGCCENCSIRPCLQWIKSPESQANATVFLAKFYGRAGLMNLINSGPEHLRPAIFRSLLYEACGRIVNPIYGSVGLLWSGSWHLCQTAVESVLRGTPITPINSETAANGEGPPLKAYDIRHVSKDENSENNRVKTRPRLRGGMMKPKPLNGSGYKSELTRSTSHDSSVSHQSELVMVDGGERQETESMVSEETAELEPPDNDDVAQEDHDELGLELTLGFEPRSRGKHVVPVKKRKLGHAASSNGATCKIELGLDFPARH